MLVEAFNINSTRENLNDSDWSFTEKFTIFALTIFYVVVTLYVAYFYPINFSKLGKMVLNRNFKQYTLANKVINIVLALLFSVLFWIIKGVETYIKYNYKHKKSTPRRTTRRSLTKGKGITRKQRNVIPKKQIIQTETYYEPSYDTY